MRCRCTVVRTRVIAPRARMLVISPGPTHRLDFVSVVAAIAVCTVVAIPTRPVPRSVVSSALFTLVMHICLVFTTRCGRNHSDASTHLTIRVCRSNVACCPNTLPWAAPHVEHRVSGFTEYLADLYLARAIAARSESGQRIVRLTTPRCTSSEFRRSIKRSRGFSPKMLLSAACCELRPSVSASLASTALAHDAPQGEC